MKRLWSICIALATIGSAGAQLASAQEAQVEVAALRAENQALKEALQQRDTEIEALRKAIAQLKKQLTDQEAQDPPAAEEIMQPATEQPRSLEGLYKRLGAKKPPDPNAAKKMGFIGKPLAVGSSGLVESVFIEEIIDQTNMVARIRFPELRGIEMAPTGPRALRRGLARGTIDPRTGKAWQTGDERVWICGIDTKGLVDQRVVWLTVPVEVVGTTKVGGETVYRVAPMPKKPAQKGKRK